MRRMHIVLAATALLGCGCGASVDDAELPTDATTGEERLEQAVATIVAAGAEVVEVPVADPTSDSHDATLDHQDQTFFEVIVAPRVVMVSMYTKCGSRS